MARTRHFLVVCTSLAVHGLADPGVNHFLGKAFVPPMPAGSPASLAQPIASTADRSALINMQREVAQLEVAQLAMKSELQQFGPQIATVATVQSQKPDAPGPQLAGAFVIGAVLGASVCFIIVKLVNGYFSSMGSGNVAELQLAGAGDATVRIPSRLAGPIMSASIPPPPPSQEATSVQPPPSAPLKLGDQVVASNMIFDPLQLADSPDESAFRREQEIKHARFAVVASAKWAQPSHATLPHGRARDPLFTSLVVGSVFAPPASAMALDTPTLDASTSNLLAAFGYEGATKNFDQYTSDIGLLFFLVIAFPTAVTWFFLRDD